MKLTASIIARYWPLTDITITKRITGKDERMACYVSSAEGEWVFKIATARRPVELVNNDTAVLEFLMRRRYRHAPRLLRATNERRYQKITGCPVYALEFISGRIPAATLVNWRRIGTAVATLHRLNAPHSLTTKFTVDAERKKMLQRAKRFGIEPAYAQMVNHLPNLEGLPRRLIHTDICLNNVIQKPNGTPMLIDWDDAGVGPAVLDVGYILTSFVTSRRVFERTKAQSFLSGYTSIRKLTSKEKRYAVDAGLFFGLDYSIHERHGINGGYWRWTKFVATHRAMIEAVLR